MSFLRPYETHAVPTEFMLLGRNKDKIVSVDEAGRSILYDVAEHAVRWLPNLKGPKFACCVSLTVGDNLYVMQAKPRTEKDGGCGCGGVKKQQCFEALVHSVGYDRSGGAITAYAVVGDSHILVSTERYGTYSFDLASSTWSTVGDWALPFRGRAEYVPEHGLWFGFSPSDDGVLGAWELSTVVTQQRPPVARVSREGFSVPEGFFSHVVHLGTGNLCVAKLFEKTRRKTCDEYCCIWETTRRFGMLTGVEVQRRGKQLDIIKHKSCRCSFGQDKIPCSVF
ncbi:hypothetical protein E2562_036834 [Oryza meyeriana var. granulata]|uniref:Uncharacterized protein n=1 Tax=Oryza meyeriana var. granulata TaxID=110450 RepID=A0A6G1E7J4_9ORYZ|nr:hypothetical protein E2562_036834 [Oryza meyeriana var. granulata]